MKTAILILSTLLSTPLLAARTQAAPLAANALPQIKSGRWEIQAKLQELPGFEQLSTACVDANTQDTLIRQKNQCSQITLVNQSHNRWVFDSVCQQDGSTVSARSTFSGNPQSQLHVDVQSHFSPPWRGLTRAHGSAVARWRGAACPADQKPGSIKVRSYQTDLNRVRLEDVLQRLPR